MLIWSTKHKIVNFLRSTNKVVDMLAGTQSIGQRRHFYALILDSTSIR